MLWLSQDRKAWDLMEDLDRIQEEFRRLQGAFTGRTDTFPACNVWSGLHDAVVTAEIPGATPDQVDVSVVGDTLTLRVNLPAPEPVDGEVLHRRERAAGQFVRTLRLPFQVDSEKVQARLINGVLQVTLPRAEQDKPRRIAIKAE